MRLMDIYRSAFREFVFENDASIIDKYGEALKRYDYWYSMSDDRNVYARGRDSEVALKKMYQTMTPDEQYQALELWWQIVFPKISKSHHGERISSWNGPDQSQLKYFNGVTLSP